MTTRHRAYETTVKDIAEFLRDDAHCLQVIDADNAWDRTWADEWARAANAAADIIDQDGESPFCAALREHARCDERNVIHTIDPIGNRGAHWFPTVADKLLRSKRHDR